MNRNYIEYTSKFSFCPIPNLLFKFNNTDILY